MKTVVKVWGKGVAGLSDVVDNVRGIFLFGSGQTNHCDMDILLNL